MSRRAGALVALALALALGAGSPARAAAAAPASPAASERPGRLTRRDAVFALGAAAAVALVATQDARWSAEAAAHRSRFTLDLAADARRLGDPGWCAAGLLATDGLARLAGHPRVAAASERIALSVGTAALATLAIKKSVGRRRPDEAPDDPSSFSPFSSHDSFPSGHATIAFALASALDAETTTRWAPALGYPLAALTAWSRVRDRRHWPSDVVAGAALGGWVARRVDLLAQRRWPRGLRLTARPAGDGGMLAVGARF